MEDVMFSSKLRDYGNVSVFTPKIKSSKRKFPREATLQRKLKYVANNSISHWC